MSTVKEDFASVIRRYALAFLLIFAAHCAPAYASELPNPNEHSYYLYVFSNSAQGKDNEYNEWYEKTHIPDVLAIPGIISAQQFVQSEIQPAARTDVPLAKKTKYLAVYKIRTTSLAAVLQEINNRARSGQTRPTDSVDPAGIDLYVARIQEPLHISPSFGDVASSRPGARQIYVQLEFADPVEGTEEKYNDWNERYHIPETLQRPGYINAERLISAEVKPALPAGPPLPAPAKYLTAFTIATTNLAKIFKGPTKNKPIVDAPSSTTSRTQTYVYQALRPVVYAEALRSAAAGAQ